MYNVIIAIIIIPTRLQLLYINIIDMILYMKIRQNMDSLCIIL